MEFQMTPIAGCHVIVPTLRTDERGFFARVWCQAELATQNIPTVIHQCNISATRLRGTVRGLHYQLSPHAEQKIIRCTQGSIFDVCADMRPDSPTYGRWFGRELTAANHAMLVIPEGCAHGFQTLEDETEIFYMVSAAYAPDAERGIRYDDPTLAIDWPLPVTDLSHKDAALPFLQNR